ncbi:MAG: chromate transporter [Lentisphaeria bacterium]|nr:chromate transporter [Lentisphaeria bacterium]
MNQVTEKRNKFTKCRILFWGFFKIAALVVGGGYAIVPAAENEFIHRKKLLTEEELLDMMAVIQSLPGIIAGNAALYIGYRSAGVAGALAALLGVATPSTAIILLIAIFLRNINLNLPAVQGAFTGAQAAITGLIALTLIRMIRKNIKNSFTLIVAVAAAAAAIVFKVSPVWIILSGGALGIVYKSALPEKVSAPKESTKSGDAK